MKLLSPASKNSSAPREPTEEVKIMRMRLIVITVMMLMERNYCFKRSKWLVKMILVVVIMRMMAMNL